MKKLLRSLILAAVAISATPGFSQKSGDDYSAKLFNDTLIIQNSGISRSYKWNGGNLATISITDKASGKTFRSSSAKPDLAFPGEPGKAENGLFACREMPETPVSPRHLEAEIEFTLGKLQIKRIFRIYADCPAIACDLYYRGESGNEWMKPGANLADMANIESSQLQMQDPILP